MSFSGDTKITLSEINTERTCCKKALLYGMLLFSSHIDTDRIVLSTETPETNDMLSGLLISCFDIMAAPDIFDKKNNGSFVYRTTISDKSDMSRIYASMFGKGTECIDRSLFACQGCEPAFLRGAFLSCGFVNPPEKDYRLEFSVHSADLAADLAVLLSKRFDMPKLSVRKSEQIVYYRDSTKVGDLLSFIGAKKSAFAIMNCQIVRDIRNTSNRQMNFEMANIEKTVLTAGSHIGAIKALIKSGSFEKLPPQLKKTAKLRIENDTLTLKELGELENPPLSKSQVSKRLSRIVAFYESECSSREKINKK